MLKAWVGMEEYSCCMAETGEEAEEGSDLDVLCRFKNIDSTYKDEEKKVRAKENEDVVEVDVDNVILKD